jgi:hypothetical protein
LQIVGLCEVYDDSCICEKYDLSGEHLSHDSSLSHGLMAPAVSLNLMPQYRIQLCGTAILFYIYHLI